MQSISIDVQILNGSWGLPRIVRRDAPWNVDRITHPLETDFDCVRDGSVVVIYVIDTGVRADHAEFGGRASGDADDHGHGTSCASIAAGATVGVARGATVRSFKGLNADNTGTASQIAAAMNAALADYQGQGLPAVVNISIFHTDTCGQIAAAAAAMIDAGMVVVACAGNDKADLAGRNVMPAKAADVIAVGGSGMADIPYYVTAMGTNYGSRVDIVAPSQRLRSADYADPNGYRPRHGTSFGTAITSGVVACMLQGHAKLTSRTQVQAVKAKLLANATTGRLRRAFGLAPLPDRLLYLDPVQTAPEPF